MSINFLKNFSFPRAISNQKANSNPCPDQIVGQLSNGVFTSSNRENIDYSIKNNNYTIQNKLTNPIVIILESPHKNEYDPITRSALGPAMGKTGENFKKYFASLIVKSKIYQSIATLHCDIVLVNAIQYQCSLGMSLNNTTNAKSRDDNFNTCFDNNNTNDLKDRLIAIAPIATINLCTAQFRAKIMNKCSNFSNYTDGNHPSSWWWKTKRKIN
ncbi:MAG: hypothetical protein K2K48_05805 [Anaeroplasmataceae bacterium]|nr:hypothetical protein [Anaeroplasmataceae bacterium]MDE6414910.1 hypothetical protein [Anaeroplasmataceae bacterium]